MELSSSCFFSKGSSGGPIFRRWGVEEANPVWFEVCTAPKTPAWQHALPHR